MQALLFLGDSLTSRFFSLQLYMILVACLILLLVFFTLFFMETLFQLVCASDLVNAKAPGAFGTKPHVLLNMPTCTCIFVLKSLYVWTTRPKICFLPVRLAVNEDSLTWCTVLSKEWKRKLQRCSSLLWSFLCHRHPVSWLPIWNWTWKPFQLAWENIEQERNVKTDAVRKEILLSLRQESEVFIHVMECNGMPLSLSGKQLGGTVKKEKR